MQRLLKGERTATNLIKGGVTLDQLFASVRLESLETIDVVHGTLLVIHEHDIGVINLHKFLFGFAADIASMMVGMEGARELPVCLPYLVLRRCLLHTQKPVKIRALLNFLWPLHLRSLQILQKVPNTVSFFPPILGMRL